MQKWKLLSKRDISPHKWFPIEMRAYELPNGKVVDDFSVSTLPDVAMIVAITTDRKVVLVQQFKPGAGDIFLQFPAGRTEPHHTDMLETAQHELEEETGIHVEKNRLQPFAKLNGFSTKATECLYYYFVTNVTINSKQKLDDTELIEIVLLTFSEMEEYILSGKIWCAETVAGWELAKKHFPTFFSTGK